MSRSLPANACPCMEGLHQPRRRAMGMPIWAVEVGLDEASAVHLESFRRFRRRTVADACSPRQGRLQSCGSLTRSTRIACGAPFDGGTADLKPIDRLRVTSCSENSAPIDEINPPGALCDAVNRGRLADHAAVKRMSTIAVAVPSFMGTVGVAINRMNGRAEIFLRRLQDKREETGRLIVGASR